MKKNVIATLGHNVQANTLETQHRYCPPGANSWEENCAMRTLTRRWWKTGKKLAPIVDHVIYCARSGLP